ncbi:hypothetical protein PO909_006276 [Leuciscus waleckii]
MEADTRQSEPEQDEIERDILITKEQIQQETESMRKALEETMRRDHRRLQDYTRNRHHSASLNKEYKNVSGTLLLEELPESKPHWIRGDNLRRSMNGAYLHKDGRDQLREEQTQCPILIKGQQGQYPLRPRHPRTGLFIFFFVLIRGISGPVYLSEKMKAENEFAASTEGREEYASNSASGYGILISSLQVCELQQLLEQTQQRRDAAKDHLYGLKHALNTVKAGVKHLSDKLQHIPLVP